jgi:hypothetical protein
MRHLQRAARIAALAIVSLGVTPLAASSAPAKPPALDVARRALVKAIAAHDWNAVAALTNFPLAVEVYGVPPKLTKAQYLKDHRKFYVFFGDGDKDLLKCVGTGQLAFQVDQTQFGGRAWYADCNGNEFYFDQRGGKWLFTAYQNINE